MSGTKITMTGADSADYQSMVGLQSRVVVFPDGGARHITLTNREWNVADWLEEEMGWWPGDLAEEAYIHALTFWCLDMFNVAAGHDVSDWSADQPEITRIDAVRAGLTTERARFEVQLRRSLRSMIRGNMARASGVDPTVNDEFP
jgi:hypothetical protein